MYYCGGFRSACTKTSVCVNNWLWCNQVCPLGLHECSFTCRSSSSFLFFSCISRIWASRASFLVLMLSKSRSLLWIWKHFYMIKVITVIFILLSINSHVVIFTFDTHILFGTRYFFSNASNLIQMPWSFTGEIFKLVFIPWIHLLKIQDRHFYTNLVWEINCRQCWRVISLPGDFWPQCRHTGFGFVS